MTTEFGKQAHLQNLSQLRLIKQVGAGNISTPRSRVKLKKTYFHYQTAYGHETWQDSNLP